MECLRKVTRFLVIKAKQTIINKNGLIKTVIIKM
jgi:hypothetical protein